MGHKGGKARRVMSLPLVSVSYASTLSAAAATTTLMHPRTACVAPTDEASTLARVEKEAEDRRAAVRTAHEESAPIGRHVVRAQPHTQQHAGADQEETADAASDSDGAGEFE